MQTCRVMISGLGNVGRSFLQLLEQQQTLLASRYGVKVLVTGAADRSGTALDASGLGLATLLATKAAGRGVASLPGVGHPLMSPQAMAGAAEADVLLEATLTNMSDGQPGLDVLRTALGRGVSVVSANKGPLVLAYAALQHLASTHGAQIRFSACVGGALPSIAIGQRDLAGCQISRVEAVLNGTTQLILRMMEEGQAFDEALAEAQRRGIAEADPSLDIHGWDAANKLVILANAVLRQPTSLSDVAVRGIADLTVADLQAASSAGKRLLLLCLAVADGERYRLSVEPTALPRHHPLGRMAGDEMGIVYHTDIAGRVSAAVEDRGPMPTAAAMLRDLLDLLA